LRVTSLHPFKSSDKEEVALLKLLYNPDIMTAIEYDLGIDLKKMDLASQIHFLRYLSGQDNKTFKRLRDVLKENKQNRMKILDAFIGFSGDSEVGNYILGIVENYSAKDVKAIFSKYNEIVASTKLIDAQSVLDDKFKDHKGVMIQGIIKKANLVLKNAFDNKETNHEKVIEELNEIHSKVLLFSVMLKTVKEQGRDVSLEDFKNVELKSVESKKLTEAEMRSMRSIYAENYKNYPEFQKYLLDNLEKVFKNKKTEWNILKFKDEIVAFMRFDKTGSDELYFGSFNVDSNAKGASIGEEMMLKVLDEKAKKNKIIAESVIGARITSNYIERGFVGVGVQTVEGVPLLKIQRDDKNAGIDVTNFAELKDKKGTYIEVLSSELENVLSRELKGSKELVHYEIKGRKHKLLFKDVEKIRKAA